MLADHKPPALPDFFKPILWSWDFEKINPQGDASLIVQQTINYGTLAHWRWIKKFYGEEKVRAIITEIPATAFRAPALRLAALIFKVNQFNYASRSAHP